MFLISILLFFLVIAQSLRYTMLYPGADLYENDEICEHNKPDEYCLRVVKHTVFCALQHGPNNITLISKISNADGYCILQFNSSGSLILKNSTTTLWEISAQDADSLTLGDWNCGFVGSCISFFKDHKFIKRFKI